MYWAVLVVLALRVGILSAAPPDVKNVWFAQRANSNLVDVWYDLSDPDGDNEFTVDIAFSSDGGATWKVVPRSVSGPVGTRQTAGAKKRVIWDAGEDYPNLRGQFVCRVAADDGVTPPPEQREQPPSSPGTPRGMTYVRKNEQGYEEYRWEKDGSTVIRIPAGTFTMGSTENADEKPVHQVYLDEYYIDKYEVTNRQYRKFCDATRRTYPSDPDFLGMPDYFASRPDHPVVNVSWNDAAAYCTWAGKRLPTEAEWEKAARGTDSRKYPWGNSEPTGQRCNLADRNTDYSWSTQDDDGYARTAPAGSYPAGASPYGCLDMAGNVWEWCDDWYGENYYASSASNNPTGPSSGSRRVLRGGSWNYGARYLRCSYRYWFEPSYRNYGLGFRCAGGR
jgi:formylglycine-generating enzyme required for sulfatase activity